MRVRTYTQNFIKLFSLIENVSEQKHPRWGWGAGELVTTHSKSKVASVQTKVNLGTDLWKLRNYDTK